MVDQSEGATRQADWEAGRDAAALEIEIEAASEYRSLAKAICKRIRALSYPGPSGAQDAPTKNCEHERVDEDGYCRKCGSDTRQGFCFAQAPPRAGGPHA